MKNSIILILILSSSTFLTAQVSKSFSDTLVSYHPQTTYTFYLTQLLAREVRFSYEKSKSNSLSFVYSLGYRFQKPNASPEVQAGAGTQYLTLPTISNKHYNGIYLAIMPKYRNVHVGNIFLCTELYNQFLWFNNRQVKYDNAENTDENFCALRTERVNTTGIKFLFETQIGDEGKISDKKGFYVSIYGGFGGFYRVYQFESSNGTWRNEPIVGIKKENGHYFFPSAHLGIKLNFYTQPK